MENKVQKKVLVIEDEPDLASVFVSLLEVCGFDSSVAENAHLAKSAVARDQFDLLIIDLTLPDSSGVDLYHELLALHPRYKGQVIFTSGFNVSDELNHVLKRDGASFLAKPFSMDKLKKVLERWM